MRVLTLWLTLALCFSHFRTLPLALSTFALVNPKLGTRRLSQKIKPWSIEPGLFCINKVHGKNLPCTKTLFFSHPDFTVGLGITPSQPLSQFVDYTTGREFHPALKNI